MTNTNSQSSILLENVSVTLGGQHILRGVNLSVQRGEFVAIVGASGGGKSTLLRLIAGLLKPSEGRVSVQSASALVFQDYRLLPWRTAYENVALPYRLGKGGTLSPEQALQLVGLNAYGKLFPHELSGGMRARVALARALAQRGEVLLLDEPFAALDALVRERFNKELKSLHEKTGQTTVLVTHSIREAVLLADKVAVLRDGQIIEVVETRGQGRLSAYTDGLEATLHDLLGIPDSTAIHRSTPICWWSPSFFFLPLLSIIIGLIIWHIAAIRLDQPFLLPTPLKVLEKGIQQSSILWSSLLITAKTSIMGGLLGGLLGLLVGYPASHFKPLERFISPFIVIMQSTPIVILAPLLVSWFGFGLLPAILVSALSAFYPLLVATLVGIRSINRSDHELMTSLDANFFQRLFYLECPAALPMLLGGLRLSTSLALIGAVVWEFTDPNQKGIGFIVMQAKNNYDMALQLAAVTLLILFGILLYSLITLLENKITRSRG